ncbi:MAG: AMP-binding protein, partial [Propionibacteriaceae bacterium]|nr:AMP-binding protein [Propionibacteriaceae bacterium]
RILTHHISMLSCAPLLVNQLDKQSVAFPNLKTIVCGGDVLKPEYIPNISKTTDIHNDYGPTETTVSVSSYRYRPGDGPDIPIGRPNANDYLYVLDETLNPQPVGVPGELCIAGEGLSMGYLNRPQLTAEKFVTVDHPEIPGGRVYRTGDSAMWNEAGHMMFLGRIDNQVSLRGYRVEPGEIENRLLEHEQIDQTAVIAGKHDDGTPYLCAYLVAVLPMEVAVLREHLAVTLPDYMIPAFFVQVDEIPLTPNGKVDKRALPEPGKAMLKESRFEAPRTPMEEHIARVWRELLQVERIGVHDNFFQMGGDSLKAIRMLSVLQKDFEIGL